MTDLEFQKLSPKKQEKIVKAFLASEQQLETKDIDPSKSMLANGLISVFASFDKYLMAL